MKRISGVTSRRSADTVIPIVLGHSSIRFFASSGRARQVAGLTTQVVRLSDFSFPPSPERIPMIMRTLRVLAVVTCVAAWTGLFTAGSAFAQGNAYVVFDVSTGQLRMNPGTNGSMTGYTIDSGSPLSWNGTAVFPSGSYPFPATNTSARIGAAFYNLTTPNVNPGSNGLTSTNLQLSSSNVVASTIAGYEGTPEWVFGNVGTTGLTLTAALNALGATSQGGPASGNRYYTQQGVTGNTPFKVYTTAAVPEPSTMVLGAGSLAAFAVARVWRRRNKRSVAAATC